MKEKVVLLCKQRGLNLSKLAEKLGISPQALAVSLTSNMRLSTLLKIADALDIPAATLLPSYEPQGLSLPLIVKLNGVSVEITHEDVLYLINRKTSINERES